MMNPYFTTPLKSMDPDLERALMKEGERQQNHIELIASENFVSKAVLEAQGSLLTNKYAEGYPDRRYYGGCQHVDEVESLAIERAKKLFGCDYANVQPHSGSQANQAVFLALLKPGDTILGMDLPAGGHLTHGSPVNQSGKFFNCVGYGVCKDTNLLDYDQVATLAKDHKPKLIIAGYSAYSRTLDFAKFREIADSVGAYLLVDMAHFAGLVATGLHPSPLPYADVVTTTTHKTLRGPRGGLILSHNPDLFKKFNSAIFPGMQGGPLMHVIAAKAVAFQEALAPAFKTYMQQALTNIKTLSAALIGKGFEIVTGGTDNHLILVDLRPKGLTGDIAEKALERANITTNKNAIPFDPTSPFVTSGLRLGSPAMTTRGFQESEFTQVATFIDHVLTGLAEQGETGNLALEKEIQEQVKGLLQQFPIYENI